jgi:hypothetical protein
LLRADRGTAVAVRSAMHGRRTIALVGLLLASLAGCGDDLELGELEAAVMEAGCERLARCGAYPSEEACLTANAGYRYDTSTMQAAVDDGSVVYDAAAARAYFDAVAASSCGWTDADQRTQEELWAKVFTGRIIDGEACQISTQCVSGACAKSESCWEQTCCEGTCAPTRAPGLPGQACSSDHRCTRDAFCTVNQLCMARFEAGTPCVDSVQCADGLVCGRTPEGEPVCTPPPQPQDLCLRDDAGNHFCGTWGLLCEPASDTCVTPLFEGGDCSGYIQRCADYLYCDRTSGTCKAYPAAGEACDSNSACASGNYCFDSVCTPLHADGAACESEVQCQSGFCDAETQRCTAPPVCI